MPSLPWLEAAEHRDLGAHVETEGPWVPEWCSGGHHLLISIIHSDLHTSEKQTPVTSHSHRKTHSHHKADSDHSTTQKFSESLANFKAVELDVLKRSQFH